MKTTVGAAQHIVVCEAQLLLRSGKYLKFSTAVGGAPRLEIVFPQAIDVALLQSAVTTSGSRYLHVADTQELRQTWLISQILTAI